MLLAKLQSSHENLISIPIKSNCFFVIVIPVRNEAEYLPKTLESLTRQVDLNNRPLNFDEFEIIFLVNNSTDESENIIRYWRSRHQKLIAHIVEKHLTPNCSNIGYVRRWLMNEAYLRLNGNRFRGGIIATTDGDTEIAPNWIAATVAEIRKGADAVGGRIFLDSSELRCLSPIARALHLRDTGYRLMAAEIEARVDNLAHDSLPRHHQHFNGSFAVTSQAFEKAGGVPEVCFLEDVAFYHALLRIDARFRHSTRVRVQTSARLDGRTELGLSTQINEWTVMGQNKDEYLVESATAIERRLKERKNLRLLWEFRRADNNSLIFEKVKSIADKLIIPHEYLHSQLQISQTFGSLYEKIIYEQSRIGEWEKENFLVPVDKAILDLRLMLEKLRFNKRLNR